MIAKENEILRWPVSIGSSEFELIVCQQGMAYVFDRSGFMRDHPDPGSRLLGIIIEADEMLHSYIHPSPIIDHELVDLARELQHRLPSKVERKWLDGRCRDFVVRWHDCDAPQPL